MNHCEICQQPSTCSVVIDDGDRKEVKSYCDFHARELALLQDQSSDGGAEKFLGFLRWLIDFIKKENRMPTKEELNKMGAAGETIPGAFSESMLVERVTFLETLIQFIEQNGRWPEEAELPIDPF